MTLNITSLLNLLFPPFCSGCGKPFTVMCDACYEKLDFNFGQISLNLSSVYLDNLQAALNYQGPIKSLIKEMKYLSVKPNAHWAGVLLYNTVNWPEVDIVTSVPLHPKRLKERGFNQAKEIARVFSQLAKLKYQDLLIRQVNTPHQASFKSKRKRLKALDKVFKLSDDINASKVKGKTILIIDDVVTTGTTLNQCAKVLKASGTKKVYGLAVAHD